MAKTGQPWIKQYPRRKDGGWQQGKDVRTLLHAASVAVHEAEFLCTDTSYTGSIGLWQQMQESASLLQEAMETYLDIYRINADEQKAAYIKANCDQFIEPERWLDSEKETSHN